MVAHVRLVRDELQAPMVTLKPHHGRAHSEDMPIPAVPSEHMNGSVQPARGWPRACRTLTSVIMYLVNRFAYNESELLHREHEPPKDRETEDRVEHMKSELLDSSRVPSPDQDALPPPKQASPKKQKESSKTADYSPLTKDELRQLQTVADTALLDTEGGTLRNILRSDDGNLKGLLKRTIEMYIDVATPKSPGGRPSTQLTAEMDDIQHLRSFFFKEIK